MILLGSDSYDVMERFEAKIPADVDLKNVELQVIEDKGKIADRALFETARLIKYVQSYVAELCTHNLLPSDYPVLISFVHLVLDGVTYEYRPQKDNDVIPEAFQRALIALTSARSIKVHVSYYTRTGLMHIGGNEDEYWKLPVGQTFFEPYILSDFIKTCSDGVFDYIDYVSQKMLSSSSWETMNVFVYGKRNGEVIRGKTETKRVPDLPNDGEWFMPDPHRIFMYKDNYVEDELDVEQFMVHVHELAELFDTSEQNFEIDEEDDKDFSFGQMTNATPEDLREFARISTDLDKHVGQSSCGFIDLSVHGPRSLMLGSNDFFEVSDARDDERAWLV